jgi:hypothetical protein
VRTPRRTRPSCGTWTSSTPPRSRAAGGCSPRWPPGPRAGAGSRRRGPPVLHDAGAHPRRTCRAGPRCAAGAGAEGGPRPGS